MKKNKTVNPFQNYLDCVPDGLYTCVISGEDGFIHSYTANCLNFFNAKKNYNNELMTLSVFNLFADIGVKFLDFKCNISKENLQEECQIFALGQRKFNLFCRLLDSDELGLDGKMKYYIFVWTEIQSTELSESFDEKNYDLVLNELEIVLDSIHDGVWIIDGNGITRHVNKALKRIANIRAKDVMGKHVTEPMLKGKFRRCVTLDALESKKAVTQFDDYMNDKRCLNTSTPILDEDGNVRSVVAVIRDMTELEKFQNSLVESELKALGADHKEEGPLLGESSVFATSMAQLKKVAKSSSSVLLMGETGTGKTLAASFIHENSQRQGKPFIPINCAAIAESLIDSELFGYQKGAFTGADQGGKKGYFELADGGTLLLDEIGELPLASQAKLLHVLDNYTFHKVGGNTQVRVDVRIIAATNRPLEDLVKEGAFRKDLYYRLNILNIQIPPLRDRFEDIPLLANTFLREACQRLGTAKNFHKKALLALSGYNWPGNVRELRGAVEYFVAMTEGSVIRVEDMKPFLFLEEEEETLSKEISVKKQTLNEAVAELERAMIKEALIQEGSSYKAAKKLGISQSSVVRKAQSFGIKLSS